MFRDKGIHGILFSLMMFSCAAQAALHDRGGGLIYDDVLDITWLADANYAQTTGYASSGEMTWAQAMIWADHLVYHDSVRKVDYSDWRLPMMMDTAATGCDFAYSGGPTVVITYKQLTVRIDIVSWPICITLI